MFWKWECLNEKCKHAFVLAAGRVPTLTCRRCWTDDNGFQLLKIQKTKYEKD